MPGLRASIHSEDIPKPTVGTVVGTEVVGMCDGELEGVPVGKRVGSLVGNDQVGLTVGDNVYPIFVGAEVVGISEGAGVEGKAVGDAVETDGLLDGDEDNGIQVGGVEGDCVKSKLVGHKVA